MHFFSKVPVRPSAANASRRRAWGRERPFGWVLIQLSKAANSPGGMRTLTGVAPIDGLPLFLPILEESSRIFWRWK